MQNDLTQLEGKQIATILKLRANEIAMKRDDLRAMHYPISVDHALELEVERLHRLADCVDPYTPKKVGKNNV